MNLTMLDERSASGASGEDGKFTFEELTRVQFNDRARVAEILRDQVVSRCHGAPKLTLNGEAIDLAPGCAVLAAWDGRFHLDSAGAPLFREFLGVFRAPSPPGTLFGDAFDPADPVATPKTLAPAPASGDDPVLVALARALLLLKTAGLEPSAALAELQRAKKGASTIPIPGGYTPEGAFNVVGYNPDDGTVLASNKRGPVLTYANGDPTPSGLTKDGYVVTFGSSFMMAVEFTDNGPHAVGLLSYSQSSDPESPHFADQTRLFSASEYRPILFSEADILADPNLKVTELAFE
jgi:acyl-homoserine-lactone acylase